MTFIREWKFDYPRWEISGINCKVNNTKKYKNTKYVLLTIQN